MRPLIPALLIAALALPAHAQVNKCKGSDGKIIYQDTPCATAGGQELNIQTRRTDAHSAYDADRQAQRDIAAARQIDRERELNRRLADIDRGARDREKQAKADRCARYESRARDADYMANNVYRTAPYKEGARADARDLRDRHWSECFASR